MTRDNKFITKKSESNWVYSTIYGRSVAIAYYEPICDSCCDDDGNRNDGSAMHRTKKTELRLSDDVIQSNESPNSRNFGNSQNRSWRVMGHTTIDEESNGELK